MPAKPTEPPEFDAPAFGVWLTRHMAIEGTGTRELAQKAGVSGDLVFRMRRGRDNPHRAARQGPMQFNVNSLAKVAWALGMNLSHLATKAGLQLDGDRWTGGFGDVERRALAQALGVRDPDDPEEFENRLHERVVQHRQYKGVNHGCDYVGASDDEG